MKKVLISLTICLLCLLNIPNASAASANISVTSSSSRVIVGNNVTITVKVSSASPLGSWQLDVVPSSNLTYVSSSFGRANIVDFAANGNQTSKTYTFVYKAKASGTATVTVKNAAVVGFDEQKMTLNVGTASFKTMTQAELESTYSKNNNLTSLKVEGYEFDKAFDKNTLEYSVTLPPETPSINIQATKEDNTASISGSGTVNLSEGLNTLRVVVTAQNGATKTYVIKATVEELKPIEVDVDGTMYSVIRKADALPTPSIYYETTTIKIGENEIPGFINKTTNVTLIGLKDSNGNISLFSYKDDKYTKYVEISFNQISILPKEAPSVPAGYTLSKLTIGETSVISYARDNKYPLIYGMNVETGKEGFYTYDNVENTLQKYQEEVKSTNIYLITTLALTGVLLVTYVTIITIVIKNRKQKITKIAE